MTKKLFSIPKKIQGIITAIFLLQSLTAEAQHSNINNKEEKMTALITRYEVKKENLEKFQKAVSDYVKESLSDESNIMSEAYFEQENQTVIWLFERWTSQMNWINSKTVQYLKR